MTTNLKHYKVYVNRLELFSRAIGVKIVIKPYADEGIWLPWTRVVKVDSELDEAEQVATILHELGHALDDILTPSGRYSDRIYKAYRATYRNKQSKAQLKLVIDAQKIAWKYGRDIAQRLRIRLGKWYDEAEKVSIKSYKA